MEPSFSPESTLDRAAIDGQRTAGQHELLTHALSRHIERIGRTHSAAGARVASTRRDRIAELSRAGVGRQRRSKWSRHTRRTPCSGWC